jgi:hypothetical protein
MATVQHQLRDIQGWEAAMTAQRSFKIRSSAHQNSRSNLALRVRIYDRALKDIIQQFIQAGNVIVGETILDDPYIEYELWCLQDHFHSLRRLDEMLNAAILRAHAPC